MRNAAPYWLIEDSGGYLLRDGGSGVSRSSLADDAALWSRQGNHFQAVAGHTLLISDTPPETAPKTLRTLGPDGRQTEELSGPFSIQRGPERKPSAYLTELRELGYTVLEQVIDEASLKRLGADIAQTRGERHQNEPPSDGHFWITDGLAWSAEICIATAHPLALWVLEQYLGTESIHFCHQPIITTLKPADHLLNTFPEGGWHSDYPYHPGVFPDDHWPEDRVLGAQFNICIDPFLAETGATQYVPGSHLLGRFPPLEFSMGGTRMGEGIHAEVRQLTAPAGSAIIYDARTWHRACPELNTSGHDRMALLNAVTPSWVRPLFDKTSVAKQYRDASMELRLSSRVAAAVGRLCNAHPTTAPPGVPPVLVIEESSTPA